MKVLTPGHKYELANHEQDDTPLQTLQFIEKEPEGMDRYRTVHNGTTNEEVLAVLINRLKTMNAKLPSRETSVVITKLEEALMWSEKRTRDRMERGVENTPQP